MKKLSAVFQKFSLTSLVLAAVLLVGATAIAVRTGSRPGSARTIATFTQDTGDARQVIVVRTPTPFENKGTLEAQEFDSTTKAWKTVVGPISASLGRNGFSASHREGDGTSPQGVFNLTEALGNQTKPTDTKLEYHQINLDSWWVSDPKSVLYNTLQTGPGDGRWNESLGEHLMDATYTTAYRYAAVIDYNRNPVVPFNGSAIFLHVGNKPTSGCVAIAEDQLVKILKWLDPAKSPKIVMGTDAWLLDPVEAPSVSGTPPVGLSVVPPARILDTRIGVGAPRQKVGPKSVIDLAIRGQGGIPSAATVVALNVTIDHPDQATFLTVAPSGASPLPNASSLNARLGDTRAALVLARIGIDGHVRIANEAGNADIIVDVVAFGSPQVVGGYSASEPHRVLDTREGLGMADKTARSPLGANALLDLPLTGVPAGATAVIMNITATQAKDWTFLTTFAGGTTRPITSTLNVRPTQDTANLAIVPLGPGNIVRFYNSSADVHVVADVSGYLLGTGGDRYVPADQPTRVMDTRSGITYRGQIGSSIAVPLTIKGLPTTATGLAATLTGVNATDGTDVKMFPSDQLDDPNKAAFSNLNLRKGDATANLVVAPVGRSDQRMLIRNANANTDIIVDVSGWFVSRP